MSPYPPLPPRRRRAAYDVGRSTGGPGCVFLMLLVAAVLIVHAIFVWNEHPAPHGGIGTAATATATP